MKSRLPSDEFLACQVKAELRKRMRALRNTMPEASRAARSESICKRVCDLVCTLAHAQTIALFWPIDERKEVDVRAIDKWLREQRKTVCYTSIAEGELVFHPVDDLTLLQERGFGFAEPPRDCPFVPIAELDVVVAPALAVDDTGYRLGYGAGYYDRALAKVSLNAASIAVAYDFQRVIELPRTDRDMPVHWVVTDARVVRVSN